MLKKAMQNSVANNAIDVAQRIQQNIKHLPIASIAIAGLLGAGAVALAASFKTFHRNV